MHAASISGRHATLADIRGSKVRAHRPHKPTQSHGTS